MHRVSSGRISGSKLFFASHDTTTIHSKPRFLAPSSLEEACRRPELPAVMNRYICETARYMLAQAPTRDLLSACLIIMMLLYWRTLGRSDVWRSTHCVKPFSVCHIIGTLRFPSHGSTKDLPLHTGAQAYTKATKQNTINDPPPPHTHTHTHTAAQAYTKATKQNTINDPPPPTHTHSDTHTHTHAHAPTHTHTHTHTPIFGELFYRFLSVAHSKWLPQFSQDSLLKWIYILLSLSLSLSHSLSLSLSLWGR